MKNIYTLERPKDDPSLYSTHGVAENAIVVAHYFLPGTNADWYVLQYDPEEDIIFGWAETIPGRGELGSSSVTELQSVEIVIPIKVEGQISSVPSRVEFDQHWKPKPLSEEVGSVFERDFPLCQLRSNVQFKNCSDLTLA